MYNKIYNDEILQYIVSVILLPAILDNTSILTLVAHWLVEHL